MILARYGYQSIAELLGRPPDDLERALCKELLDDLLEQENLNSVTSVTTTTDD